MRPESLEAALKGGGRGREGGRGCGNGRGGCGMWVRGVGQKEVGVWGLEWRGVELNGGNRVLLQTIVATYRLRAREAVR